jgi:UDP-N-acetylmuramoyl-L-alanyl-D-glutamate--2,6-diaminopimelate ligase
MKLFDLFRLFPEAQTIGENLELSGMQLDSRAIKPGDLFVALVGSQFDGRAYISDALESGAVAVLVDEPLSYGLSVPVVIVPNLKSKISKIASQFFGDPSSQLSLLGVTGTNGKSSVCEYVRQLSGLLKHKAASIGTLGVHMDGQLDPLANTTPDVVSLNALLAKCVGVGISLVTMEVSSHALVQNRVQGLKFDIGVFTNLSQDHLDYHHTMDEYAAAKSELFKLPNLQTAIINIDDDYSGLMCSSVPEGVRCYQFSLMNSVADAYFSDIHWFPDGGCEARIHVCGEAVTIRTSLIGEFNLYNLLASVLVLRLHGHSLTAISDSIPSLHGVNGRMQHVENDEGVIALVDYAHTPDALRNVLETLNIQRESQETSGQIYTVVGCGGDRDQSKRPQMGKIASELSDHVWVTSDNPRSEDPVSICNDVVSGIEKNNYQVSEARESAIQSAVNQAQVGDFILVAGKGHEKTQTIGADILHFDDVEEIKKAFERKADHKIDAEQGRRRCH